MFFERWFWSSNAKDIGTLYLMFSLFAGLVGTAFSVLIRIELSAPGVQFIGDNQLYNSIITAHAIVMIFFMVKNSFIFNIVSRNFLHNKYTDNNNLSLKDSNNKNNNNNNDNKYNYVKVIIEDPFNNRDVILGATKGKKGVYVWKSIEGNNVYVGHSINLYYRISSYFIPSILKTKARRILRYFNKHNFNDMKLIIYIMNASHSTE